MRGDAREVMMLEAGGIRKEGKRYCIPVGGIVKSRWVVIIIEKERDGPLESFETKIRTL